MGLDRINYQMPKPKKVGKIGRFMETRGRPKAYVGQPLTRKQEKFVKELVANDGHITLQEAAINAGYSASSAHTRAYELTNPHVSPHVVAAIKEYRRELDEKYSITFSRHMRDLQKIRDEALQNGAYSAAVQAEYRRGQAHGDIYVSKSEVRHGSIDSMSKEDVLKALEEIKSSYEPITIDITPEEDENRGNRGKVRERLLSSGEASGTEDNPETITDPD